MFLKGILRLSLQDGKIKMGNLRSEQNRIIVSMKGISKSFLGVKVLDNVDFSLRKGEVIALLGANGAGKSTLMKILCGIYRADRGQIYLNGNPVKFTAPIDAFRAGISIVHQESSLIPTLTVMGAVFLGHECVRHAGILNSKSIFSEYRDLSEHLGLDASPKTKIRDLNPAQRKIAEIMKAVSRKSSILIMDEPTESLSKQETLRLFEIVNDLKQQGMSIVFITHFLDEVRSIADSATVIRDGRIVAEDLSPQVPIKNLVSLMLGREIVESRSYKKSQIGNVVLEVNNLGRKNEFTNVSFDAHAGEVIGIIGVVGSGKSELAKTLSGASTQHKGTIKINGKTTQLHTPHDALKHGIGMVPEDRKTQGLILNHSIISNITLSSLSTIARWGIIFSKIEKSKAEKVAFQLSIKYVNLKQKIKYLSGGNQQKCILARWILSSPQILILDEPTHGIDVATKDQIYHIIRDLAANGKSVLYFSDDPKEALTLSDRILVMQKGKIKRTFWELPSEDMLLKEMIEVNNEQ
ncbi:MAG: Ribose import ATP-binding protein RbsA [Spirochaetes bacterium ADurb.Bin110]|nr:MAG: Ribose import ATP-binding protein RbsA [Spirochaetes bacterium ADurb.Bin110]